MVDNLHQTVNELSEVKQEIKEQVVTLQGQHNILHSILRRLILINTPTDADHSVWDSQIDTDLQFYAQHMESLDAETQNFLSAAINSLKQFKVRETDDVLADH